MVECLHRQSEWWTGGARSLMVDSGLKNISRTPSPMEGRYLPTWLTRDWDVVATWQSPPKSIGGWAAVWPQACHVCIQTGGKRTLHCYRPSAEPLAFLLSQSFILPLLVHDNISCHKLLISEIAWNNQQDQDCVSYQMHACASLCMYKRYSIIKMGHSEMTKTPCVTVKYAIYTFWKGQISKLQFTWESFPCVSVSF